MGVDEGEEQRGRHRDGDDNLPDRQATALFVKVVHLGPEPLLDAPAEGVDRLHDLELGCVVLRAEHDRPCQLEVGRPGDGVPALRVPEPALPICWPRSIK